MNTNSVLYNIDDQKAEITALESYINFDSLLSVYDDIAIEGYTDYSQSNGDIMLKTLDRFRIWVISIIEKLIKMIATFIMDARKKYRDFLSRYRNATSNNRIQDKFDIIPIIRMMDTQMTQFINIVKGMTDINAKISTGDGFINSTIKGALSTGRLITYKSKTRVLREDYEKNYRLCMTYQSTMNGQFEKITFMANPNAKWYDVRDIKHIFDEIFDPKLFELANLKGSFEVAAELYKNDNFVYRHLNKDSMDRISKGLKCTLAAIDVCMKYQSLYDRLILQLDDEI